MKPNKIKPNNQILEKLDKIETMAANIKFLLTREGSEGLIDYYLQQIGEIADELRNNSKE